MATNVTTRMQAPVLLVGSMPFTTVEEALRASGELLGGDLACIPDGEVGPRALWVGFLPIGVYLSHPGLEVMHARSGPLQQPKNSDDSSAVRIDPEGRQTFRVRPGSDLKLDLKYGEFAQESYEVFKRLRSDGVIPDAVRFQACIPAPSSGADPFFEDVDQWPAVHKAYIDGINHAVETMLETIPADDLVVQLDFCWEVIDIEFGERSYFPHWPVATVEEKFERHTDLLARAARDIPEEVWLGYHLCYGTWGGWPMTAMRDLDLCVRLANAVVPKTGRRVHYVHMPATEGAGDAFFAPLDRLEIGDTRIYLGLIHEDELGVERIRRRIEQAQRHLADFGIAAVCGYGRVDPAELPEVLRALGSCAAEARTSLGRSRRTAG